MKYKNEGQIKKALGIDSWENLPKEKISQFAEMMPQMDKEVVLKIIEQLPAFTQYAAEIVKYFETVYSASLESNDESQKSLHTGYADLRRIIEKQLDKDDITLEEKKYFIDKLFELIDKELKKDTENKEFVKDILNKAIVVGGTALVAALLFVGVKIMNNRD